MKKVKKVLAMFFAVVIAVVTVIGISSATLDVEAAGTNTVTDVLGISRQKLVSTLGAELNTGYYLGTPYRPNYATSTWDGTNQDPNADWRQPNGDPTAFGYATNSGVGMNCTGFVWHVLVKAGAQAAQVPNLAVNYNGTYAQGGWQTWLSNNNVKTYDFNTKAEMLASGVLEKGDIIWSWDVDSSVSNDHHVGFFWGDSPTEDKYWHSGPNETHDSYGNMISPIVSKASAVTWTVVKFQESGDLSLIKSSSDPSITGNNSCYSLAGAVYELYDSAGTVVATLTTDADGKASATGIIVGDYTLKEITPPKGYELDTKVYNITIKSGETTTKTVSDDAANDPIVVVLKKVDAETEESAAQGSASMAGAQFTFNYYDGYYTLDTLPKAPTRSWVVETKANTLSSGSVIYRCHLSDEYKVSGDAFYYTDDNPNPTLPLGTVTVQETKAPEGYLLNGEINIQQITADSVGQLVTVFNEYELPEQVKRGDIEGVKVSDGDLKRLGGIPFKITAKSTITDENPEGENHVVITNENGEFSTASSWNPHSQNTNRGETAEDGVWFGRTDALDDEKGALYYDTYIIEEMRCDANADYALIPPFEVTVTRDSHVVNLGTLTNDYAYVEEPTLIEISTTATFKDGSKSTVADGEVIIVDSVKMTGLTVGTTYKLVGWEMDKAENTKFTVDGEDISNSLEFEATAEDMTVEIEFKFDATGLKDIDLVTFEELYDVTDPDEPTLVAEHKDIEDEGQTVRIEKEGTIKTSTPGGNTISGNVKTGDSSNVVLFMVVVLICMSVVIILIYKKRKRGSVENEGDQTSVQ